jgi:protein subunit release factor B
VTKRISINEREVQETLLRFVGPGGQNANKAAAAVHRHRLFDRSGFGAAVRIRWS